MAWLEMSYNHNYSRRNEIARVKETEFRRCDVEDELDDVCDYYGTIEDFIDGYSVEEVYATLKDWN